MFLCLYFFLYLISFHIREEEKRHKNIEGGSVLMALAGFYGELCRMILSCFVGRSKTRRKNKVGQGS